MKTCKRCTISKEENLFGKNKNNKDGLSIYCFDCERLRGIEYREKNRNKVNESAKSYRKNNPEKYKESIEKYLTKNPHMTSKERMKKYMESDDFRSKYQLKQKDWRIKNIDKLREKRKEYYHNNKEKENEKNNIWKKNKMKTDGFFRMKKNLRDRIRDYLKGNIKSKRTKEIIGIDYEEFRNYISNMFTEGMSWDNYGNWHLDHIIPLCEAKNEEEIIKLNHYTNLQPLWAEDNLKKNRKYGN
jgi:hypothetical protein